MYLLQVNKGIKDTAKTLVVLLLLIVYSGASLRIDSIHQFYHSKNVAELHSAKQESDPCHKNIYHQQNKAGCEHKAHISEASKCPMCEHSVVSNEILAEFEFVPEWPQRILISVFNQESLSTFYHHQLSDRAPPEIV